MQYFFKKDVDFFSNICYNQIIKERYSTKRKENKKMIKTLYTVKLNGQVMMYTENKEEARRTAKQLKELGKVKIERH